VNDCNVAPLGAFGIRIDFIVIQQTAPRVLGTSWADWLVYCDSDECQL